MLKSVKKIVAFCLTFALCCSLITPIQVFGAVVTVNTEQELRSALLNGDSVVLGADITLTAAPMQLKANYSGYIDGGGHALTSNIPSNQDMLYVSSENPTLEIKNITIDGAGKSRAIYMLSGTITFSGTANGPTTVQNCSGLGVNTANGHGGAIYVNGQNSKIVLNENVTFSNNQTGPDNINGGAINATQGATVEVHGAMFEGNHCDATSMNGREGGAIWIGNGASFIMDSGTIKTGNKFNVGGGIDIYGASKCQITGGEFILDNLGDGYGISGGAIAMVNVADPNALIQNVSFKMNNAASACKVTHAGGFIDFVGANNVTIDKCTFVSENNKRTMATYGGAICFETGTSGTATITDCTFTNCSADRFGGTICVGGDDNDIASHGSNVVLNIKNTNISGGETWTWSKFYGGGIYIAKGNTVTIDNSSITGCRGGFGGGIYNSGETKIIDTKVDANNVMSAHDNGAFGGTGGGIYNNGKMEISGAKSSVSDNQIKAASWEKAGAGMGIYNDGELTIAQATIKGNENPINLDNPGNPVQPGQKPLKEYAGQNIYCNKDVTLGKAVVLDEGDIRVLDKQSSIILMDGKIDNPINVSISENAATVEKDERHIGYLVAKSGTGQPIQAASLNKIKYVSYDTTNVGQNNDTLYKWVYMYNPDDKTIVVGQNIKLIFDPNEENFTGAAFASTLNDSAATLVAGNAEKVLKIYSTKATTKADKLLASDNPKATHFTFTNWYDTAVTKENVATNPSANAVDFDAVTVFKGAEVNSKITTLLANRDVTVYAGYKQDPKYSVTYQWDGDAPAGKVAPTDNKTYFKGDTVTVDTTYTKGDTVPGTHGTWTFGGWKDGNTEVGATLTMGDADVTLVGKWTFKQDPKYSVTYQWDGDAPAGKVAPTDNKTYFKGDTVTVDTTYTKGDTVPGTHGTWTFGGWKDGNTEVGATLTMGDADVTLVGKWTFKQDPKYSVTYQWDGDAPAGKVAPTDNKTYFKGDTVTVDTTYTKGDTVPGTHGTWTFGGWKDGNTEVGATLTMGDADVTLVGKWTFKQDPKYSVTYQWDGDAPAGKVAPTDNKTYFKGDTVTIDTTYTKGDTVPGTHGAWTFGGWKDGNTEVGATLTMGDADVTLVGKWTYKENATIAPKTGDSSNIKIYFAVGAIAVIALIALFLYRRRAQ